MTKTRTQPKLPTLAGAKDKDLDALCDALHTIKRIAGKVEWSVSVDHYLAAVMAEIARRVQRQIL